MDPIIVDVLKIAAAAFGAWGAVRYELGLMRAKVERAERDIQTLFTLNSQKVHK